MAKPRRSKTKNRRNRRTKSKPRSRSRGRTQSRRRGRSQSRGRTSRNVSRTRGKPRSRTRGRSNSVSVRGRIRSQSRNRSNPVLLPAIVDISDYADVCHEWQSFETIMNKEISDTQKFTYERGKIHSIQIEVDRRGNGKGLCRGYFEYILHPKEVSTKDKPWKRSSLDGFDSFSVMLHGTKYEKLTTCDWVFSWRSLITFSRDVDMVPFVFRMVTRVSGIREVMKLVLPSSSVSDTGE